MGTRSPLFKASAIIWALLIGGGFVLLVASVMLPSTKRARIDPDDVERYLNKAAATVPTTAPATAPDIRDFEIMSSSKSLAPPTVFKRGIAERFELLTPSTQPTTAPTR